MSTFFYGLRKIDPNIQSYEYNGNIINFNKGLDDKYNSVNSFIKVSKYGTGRKESNIFELLYFYVDLDVYNADLNEEYKIWEEEYFKLNGYEENEFKLQHEFIMKNIIEICKENKLPKPSIVNYSGNGYQLFWKIKAIGDPKEYNREKLHGVPAHLLNSYKLVQHGLIQLFSKLGADTSASDAARVMRSLNTFNSKTCYPCINIYNSKREFKFKTIADKVLPYTIEQVNKYKADKVDKMLENLNAQPTDKQIEVLNKYNLKAANKVEAQYLIKKHINVVRKNNSSKYIITYLNKLFENGYIKEGNRTHFFYTYGIGLKRAQLQPDKEKVYILSEKLNFCSKTAFKTVLDGYNGKYNYISYNRINKKLNLNFDARSFMKNKRTRISKSKSNSIAIEMMKEWKVDKNTSSRKLAKKYNSYKVSKDKVLQIKKRIQQILKENKQKNFYTIYLLDSNNHKKEKYIKKEKPYVNKNVYTNTS